MTKKEIRQKYCDKRNYTSWNKYNITEYSKWLENELIKTQKQVKKLTTPDVVGRSEQLVCETSSDIEVKEQGDWCDKCLGIETNEAN